jgi:hypothetical protein
MTFEQPKQFRTPLEQALDRLEKAVTDNEGRWQELVHDNTWEGFIDRTDGKIILRHLPTQTRSETYPHRDTIQVFYSENDSVCEESGVIALHQDQLAKLEK